MLENDGFEFNNHLSFIKWRHWFNTIQGWLYASNNRRGSPGAIAVQPLSGLYFL